MRHQLKFCLWALLALFSSLASAVEIAPGTLLVAKPRVGDHYFKESVVLIVQTGPLGTAGVILNRPGNATLGRAFPHESGFRGEDVKLGFGGPVHVNIVSFLFRSAETLPQSIRVFGDVHMSSRAALLKEAMGDAGLRASVRAFAGYAGWYPGQLEAEIGRGDWYLERADDVDLFADPKTLWDTLIKRASLIRA
jgi:putative transcriptional regulator